MRAGMAPKAWPLWKAPNEPNRMSFDPLLYSVVFHVSEKPLELAPQFSRSQLIGYWDWVIAGCCGLAGGLRVRAKTVPLTTEGLAFSRAVG